MTNLKEFSKRPERLAPGHRLCPGCGLSIITRAILKATEDPVVVTNATGCLEVSTTIYPFSSWRVPWMHNAFENAAATLSGIEKAYVALKKKGKINRPVKFLAFGGDGGTYDIGLQSLSGMLERGHDTVYVCVDNEGYMNTGIQRSSSTPYGAWTKTSPVGAAHQGKEQFRKDLTEICAAHHIPYIAQASIHNFMDLIRKAETAFNTPGPAFINVLSPCIPGWRTMPQDTVSLAKTAVLTNFWPLYEVVNDKWVLNFDPGDKKLPIEEWLKPQRRFRHLFREENKHIIGELQAEIDRRFELLKRKAAISKD